MWSNFTIDVDDKSFSFNHTAIQSSQRLAFNVVSLGHFFAREKYYTEREGLDNYLLIYTINGTGYIKSKNSEYILYPNQAVLIYCGDYHLYKAMKNKSWEFKWIHFNGVCAKEYYNFLNGNDLSLINIDDFSKTDTLFNEIKEIMENDVVLPDLKICSLITQLITGIILIKNSPLNNEMYYQHKTEIQSAIKYIEENYNKNINVNEISYSAHLSKYYFIKIFKTFTGSSPYEYLINYRIAMSKKKLLNTNLKINEISQIIGFTDTNNFIRCFKRIVGTTPLKYRNHWHI
jgi:AraC-like DNA-binding protein